MTVFIIIFITAVLSLFAGVSGKNSGLSRYIGLLGLLVAFSLSYMPDNSFFLRYESMYFYDASARILTQISIFITVLIFFLGGFAFGDHRSHQSELYSLMLLSLCGGIVLFGFKNLITLFLGIEILSIPLYVLVGSNKTNLSSIEASMKYFLTGAFATGFLLFGIAMIFGSVGSFDLTKIHNYSLHSGKNPMFVIGLILMFCAMAFKASLAPFHSWSPDVYQGSPSLITSFMATVVKIAAFRTLFRLMLVGFVGSYANWINIISSLAIITLILANVVGLVQNNVKRMLAYSSVSHAGYITLIFFGMDGYSFDKMVYYLVAYSISTIGAFIMLIWVEKLKGDSSVESFKGMGRSYPVLSVVATISMLSMAGIPLTAGFIGKFTLFAQAINTAPYLVVIAIIGSALSIAYYLRPIKAMFFSKEVFISEEKVSFTYNVIALIVGVLIIALGVYPNILL